MQWPHYRLLTYAWKVSKLEIPREDGGAIEVLMHEVPDPFGDIGVRHGAGVRQKKADLGLE